MGDPEIKPGGVLSSLRRAGESLLALAQSRLQLFALDLQSEKLRLLEALLWLGLGLAIGAVGLILGTVTLALYVWARTGYAGLLVLTGVYLGVGALILWRLRQRLRQGPAPFAQTIAEFQKDRACLQDKD
jgi:uncharacterized membrane protein YqjE